jgi:hypothetical protein
MCTKTSCIFSWRKLSGYLGAVGYYRAVIPHLDFSIISYVCRFSKKDTLLLRLRQGSTILELYLDPYLNASLTVHWNFFCLTRTVVIPRRPES